MTDKVKEKATKNKQASIVPVKVQDETKQRVFGIKFQWFQC